MTQEQLGYKVGLEYTAWIVKNLIRFLNYWKYIAYKKGWINEKIARDQKIQAQMMKKKYPKPEDWYCVRLNNEVHFGYGP